MAVAMLSVMSGATAVPINTDLDDDTLIDLWQRVHIDAVIVSQETPPRIASVARRLSLAVASLSFHPTDPAGTHTLHWVGSRTPVAPEPAIVDDIALVLHTSGTTGKPKIVPLTQTSQATEALHRVQVFEITSEDCCLCVAPLFTASGLRRSLFPVLVAGGRVVCPPSFDGDRMIDWLSQFEPTFYAAGPAVHRALLDAIVRHGKRPVHSLRYIISGTTALAPELQSRFEEAIGAPVIQTYAMTEAGGIANTPLPPAEQRPGSVGLPSRGEVAIVDDAGIPVEAGQLGEIVVRGPQVFAGYEDDPQANAGAFFGDWFRTGDIGRVDDDGYLFITGRVKEIINRGGFKVSPAEVDAALARHPAVADVATFGIKHASLGEDVMAAVVLRGDASVTAQTLRDFAFETIADFKVPTQIVLVPSIPRTTNGKVRRRDLVAALAPEIRPAYTTPRDEHEYAIAALFGEVLKVRDIGAFDNFFALGGDSLRSAQVAARASKHFGCSISGEALFRRPTVAEFSADIKRLLQDADRSAPPPIVPLPRHAH